MKLKLKKNRTDEDTQVNESKEHKEKAPKGSGGWLRVVKGNRALTVVGGIALLSLGFGLGASNLFVNNASASMDEAPEPGLITVPVVFGPLENTVTMRADIGFINASDVTLNTASIVGPAIVTGQIPEPGDELNPLSVAVEITGRPVIVLPGELPSYRTLSVGMSGPDVVQFKEAMREVGINAGDPANDVFDETAANAVRELYARVGYTVPTSEAGTAGDVAAAQVRLDEAQRNLAGAIIEADRQIRDAENDWAAWPCEDPSPECRQHRLDLDTARARPLEVAARQQITDAQNALNAARQGALPQLPVSEVLFLNELPRRVDSVSVTRGTAVTGVSMRVSGAVLLLRGSATEANVRNIHVGDEAFFDLPGGGIHRAVVETITEPTDGSRWMIEFTPDPLTQEEFLRLQNSNVAIRIPVGATAGSVLNVPVAALTAGPGGVARVEIVDGDPRLGAAAATRIVNVEVGLTAQGFSEITPTDGGSILEGDLVVVGQ